jgi:hypothetical protein
MFSHSRPAKDESALCTPRRTFSFKKTIDGPPIDTESPYQKAGISYHQMGASLH